MKRILKIILYIFTFIFALFLFLPKESLYNLLEKQFEYLDKDDVNIKYEIDNTEINFNIIDEL